ncbi:unnamed protein product [Ilex paraguariensis]|uniref:Uncharacterized protein n=1 Tax=Ilex paraguariensis TaxID=185542 RepID=A0ABC8R2T0_9AQUA
MNFYNLDDDDDGENQVEEDDFERRQLKHVMKESCQMTWMEEESRRYSVSQPSGSRIKRRPPRSYSVKEGVSVPVHGGIDSYMFSPKQKSVKDMFSGENLKKVAKAISKFFLFNAIPFNAADSGLYYQSMIDTIAEAGPGIKGPIGYQIGNSYLEEEEVQELDVYISSMKVKWLH